MGPPAPFMLCSAFKNELAGILATIPIIIIREIPFPMPLSVIFSPSHITNIVPAVRMITDENLKKSPDRYETLAGSWHERLKGMWEPEEAE